MLKKNKGRPKKKRRKKTVLESQRKEDDVEMLFRKGIINTCTI